MSLGSSSGQWSRRTRPGMTGQTSSAHSVTIVSTSSSEMLATPFARKSEMSRCCSAKTSIASGLIAPGSEPALRKRIQEGPSHAPDLRPSGCVRSCERRERESLSRFAAPPLPRAVFGVVFDRLSLDQEHDVFGDVGREVRYPLQVATHEEELHRGPDDVRVLHHVREQNAEHRLMEGIHAVVATADGAAGLCIPS